MPPTAEADGRKRAFLVMNGIGGSLLLSAVALGWVLGGATARTVALVLVVVAIGLAVASYPFYRAWMRDDLVRRTAARRSRAAKRQP